MFFKHNLLPLFDANGGGGGNGGGDPNGTDPNGTNPNPNGDPNGKQDPTPKGADKTFTQAELEAIIADRLAREKRKADEKAENARKEAERKALEEQGKYKDMYEQLQKDLDAQKVANLEAKKEAMLLGAGYTKEQADRYKKYLAGSDEVELGTALEALKADIPPNATNYVDPANAGNGQKQGGKQEDPAEYGKSVFARLKASGRIKGIKADK